VPRLLSNTGALGALVLVVVEACVEVGASVDEGESVEV